jgi:preprotein translocase subunit SecG
VVKIKKRKKSKPLVLTKVWWLLLGLLVIMTVVWYLLGRMLSQESMENWLKKIYPDVAIEVPVCIQPEEEREIKFDFARGSVKMCSQYSPDRKDIKMQQNPLVKKAQLKIVWVVGIIFLINWLLLVSETVRILLWQRKKTSSKNRSLISRRRQ